MKELSDIVRRRNGLTISTNKALLDEEMICQFLAQSYWASKRTSLEVKKSIKNSLCFGVYDAKNVQVGFARIITDYATFSYLADVFIIPSHRGLGLGKWLMETIFSIEEIRNIRCLLFTTDAHGLYEPVGFQQFPYPERVMVKLETL